MNPFQRFIISRGTKSLSQWIYINPLKVKSATNTTNTTNTSTFLQTHTYLNHSPTVPNTYQPPFPYDLTNPLTYTPPVVIIGAAFSTRPPNMHTITPDEALQLAMEQEQELRKVDNVKTSQLLTLYQSLQPNPNRIRPPEQIDPKSIVTDLDGRSDKLKALLVEHIDEERRFEEFILQDSNIPIGYDINDSRFEQLYEAQRILKMQYDQDQVEYLKKIERFEEEDEYLGDSPLSLASLLRNNGEIPPDQEPYSSIDEAIEDEVNVKARIRVSRLVQEVNNGERFNPNYDDMLAIQHVRNQYVRHGKMGPGEPFFGLSPRDIYRALDWFERQENIETQHKTNIPGAYTNDTDEIQSLNEEELDAWIFDGGNRQILDTKTIEKIENELKLEKQSRRAKVLRRRRLEEKLRLKLEEQHGSPGPEPDRKYNPKEHAKWREKVVWLEKEIKKRANRIIHNSPQQREKRELEMLAHKHIDRQLRYDNVNDMALLEAYSLYNQATPQQRELLMELFDEQTKEKEESIKRLKSRKKRLDQLEKNGNNRGLLRQPQLWQPNRTRGSRGNGGTISWEEQENQQRQLAGGFNSSNIEASDGNNDQSTKGEQQVPNKTQLTSFLDDYDDHFDPLPGESEEDARKRRIDLLGKDVEVIDNDHINHTAKSGQELEKKSQSGFFSKWF